MLQSFLLVIPLRLNFMCRRFETLCLFHLHRRCKQEEIFPTYTTYEDGTDRMFQKRRHLLVKREEIFPAYTTYEDGTVFRKVGTKIQTPGNYLKERI